MNRQHRHIRRGDPADPQRLPQTVRRELRELLLRLIPQPHHFRIIHRMWNELPLHLRRPLDLPILPMDVTFVLDADLDLSSHVRVDRRKGRALFGQQCPIGFRTAQPVGCRDTVDLLTDQRGQTPGDLLFSRIESRPSVIIHQSDRTAQFRQTCIGVVVPQMQPVLGPAGEHAVRFRRRFGDQIIDQHPDVRLIPP